MPRDIDRSRILPGICSIESENLCAQPGERLIQVITDVEAMQTLADERHREGLSIGLVPTMGALHEGHLSLVDLARKRADFVVVSIFVNPTQFAPEEDFKKYPRMVEEDIRLLEQRGAHAVFTPDDAMMYPAGYSTYISVEGLTEVLCGRLRPNHFRGVTTIVAKLFHCVRPDFAVFGQKDAQQLAVIRRMVRDLNMSVDIVAGPIVREPDGLATSSRNRYLSQEERSQAAVLFRSLEEARKLGEKGVTSASLIIEKVCEVIGNAPLARIDYVEVVDTEFLQPVDDIAEGALLAIAVWFGETRLIDNISITPARRV